MLNLIKNKRSIGEINIQGTGRSMQMKNYSCMVCTFYAVNYFNTKNAYRLLYSAGEGTIALILTIQHACNFGTL